MPEQAAAAPSTPQTVPWQAKLLGFLATPTKRDPSEYLLTFVLVSFMMCVVAAKIKYEKWQEDRKKAKARGGSTKKKDPTRTFGNVPLSQQTTKKTD